MKTERRHQHEHNTLARYLEKFILATKAYHSTILIVFIGLVLLCVIWSVYGTFAKNASGSAWNEIYQLSGGGILPPDRVMNGFQAPTMVGENRFYRPEDKPADVDAEKLLAFGKKHAHETVGVVALLNSGNATLEKAAQILRMRSPQADEAAALLKDGMETLALAEKHAKGDYKLQAQLALGRGFELQAVLGDTKENLQKAREKYDLVAVSNSPLAALAKSTVATLEKPGTESLYTVLAQRIAHSAEAAKSPLGDGGINEFDAPALDAMPAIQEPAVDLLEMDSLPAPQELPPAKTSPETPAN